MQCISRLNVDSTVSGVQIEVVPGRIRVDAPQLIRHHGGKFIGLLIERTLRAGAVRNVVVDPSVGRLTIDYDRRQWGIAEALVEIACHLHGGARHINGAAAHEGGDNAIGVREFSQIEVHSKRDSEANECGHAPPEFNRRWSLSASGVRRAVNLAAAGGCFGLTIIALVAPGIPSVPFCLATSYFLVRSSPSLNQRLRRTPLLGSIIRDFEDQGGLQATTKSWAVVMAIVAASATVAMTGLSLPVVATTVAVGILDLWLVLRPPTIVTERRPALQAGF